VPFQLNPDIFDNNLESSMAEVQEAATKSCLAILSVALLWLLVSYRKKHFTMNSRQMMLDDSLTIG